MTAFPPQCLKLKNDFGYQEVESIWKNKNSPALVVREQIGTTTWKTLEALANEIEHSIFLEPEVLH